MKKLVWILAALLFWTACERDDLCLEKPAVPLRAAFADDFTGDPKPVTLTVLYGQDTVLASQTSDTLDIPLPVDGNSVRYVWIKEDASPPAADTVEIRYTLDKQFVSKACGWKTVYKDVDMEVYPGAVSWIKAWEILTAELTVDTIAHVKIYH